MKFTIFVFIVIFQSLCHVWGQDSKVQGFVGPDAFENPEFSKRLSDLQKVSRNYRVSLASNKKTQWAILLVHSYMMDTREMDHWQDYFFNLGHNTISLSYAGHERLRSDKTNLRNIDYHHWIRDIDRNVKVAKMLGDKLLVIGLSLGGLLSGYHALTHHDEIQKLILIAPAFRTRFALGNDSAACLGRFLINHFKWADNLAKEISGESKDDLRREFIYGSCPLGRMISHLNQTLSSTEESLTEKERTQWVFSQLRVPTIIYSAEHDEIIDSKNHVEIAMASSHVQLIRLRSNHFSVVEDSLADFKQRVPLNLIENDGK